MPLAVGLFVDARIDGRVVEDAVRIPSRGLRPGDQIYVVDASGLPGHPRALTSPMPTPTTRC
jgi:hypothetical protein